MPEALAAYLRARTPELIDELGRWIEIESFSSDVTAVSWMINVVGERLQALGAQVHRLSGSPQADHLLASWPGEGEPLIIVGHVDTVYPRGTLEEFPFRIDGDVVRGPGVSDVKGCVLLACAALEALRATSRWTRRPLKFLVTSDEEVGSPTSRQHIEAQAKGCRAALIIESAGDGGFLKVWRKSVSMYELTAEGRASHAGVAPELGISAIHELAHHINAIVALARPDIGTTINIGLIEGGTAGNVVAAEASCRIDVRALTVAEAERVDLALRDLTPHLAGARLTLSGGINRPAMEQTPGNMGLYDAAEAIATELGFAVTPGGTGGGSDGNFTSALGTPTLDGLGGVGSGSHSLDEWFSIPEFAPRAAMLAKLIENL
jgi:glutamate carboxypeptidase